MRCASIAGLCAPHLCSPAVCTYRYRARPVAVGRVSRFRLPTTVLRHQQASCNLYRTLQTLRNLLDELHSVATLLDNHTALLDVIVQAQQALIRDIAIGDSLYLRL